MEKPLSAKLEDSIHSCLEETAAEAFEPRWQKHPPATSGSANGTSTDVPGKISEASSEDRDTPQNGLLALLSQARQPGLANALEYARAVIERPENTIARASFVRNRSCSDLHRELLTQYGAQQELE